MKDYQPTSLGPGWLDRGPYYPLRRPLDDPSRVFAANRTLEICVHCGHSKPARVPHGCAEERAALAALQAAQAPAALPDPQRVAAALERLRASGTVV